MIDVGLSISVVEGTTGAAGDDEGQPEGLSSNSNIACDILDVDERKILVSST
jgi:hypothetical protein